MSLGLIIAIVGAALATIIAGLGSAIAVKSLTCAAAGVLSENQNYSVKYYYYKFYLVLKVSMVSGHLLLSLK